MKLFTTDNREMMQVNAIRAEKSALVIDGIIMGAMPIKVKLGGYDMRRVVPMLSCKVIFTVLRMLLTGK